MFTTGNWCNPVSNMLHHVEKGLSGGTTGLGMTAAFWAGIPVEVTQEADVFPRCRRAAIGKPF